MSEQNTSSTSFVFLPCGCQNTIENEQVVKYDPCLACALTNAGIMLQAAGQRMHDKAESDAKEADEEAENVRRQIEGFIGGSD